MTATTGTEIDEQYWLIVAECFGLERPTFQGEGPSWGVPALFTACHGAI